MKALVFDYPLRRQRLCPAARLVLFAAVSLILAYLAAILGAEAAFSQELGRFQDSPLHRTGINVRDAILSLGFICGGIGFGLGILLKALAHGNENMHHASHIAMKGGGVAVILTAIAVPLLSFFQGLGAS